MKRKPKVIKKRKKVKAKVVELESTPNWDQISILCLQGGFILDYDPGKSIFTSWYNRPQYVYETIDSLWKALQPILEEKESQKRTNF